MLPAHLARVDDEVAVLASPDDEALLDHAVQASALGQDVEFFPSLCAQPVLGRHPLHPVHGARA
jgi:hypothetical protein